MDRLQKVLIPPRTTVKQALRKMDQAGEKTLLVAGGRRRLLGSVTDGDIRRWMLKSGRMTAPIVRVMNADPLTFPEVHEREAVKAVMAAKSFECVPIVDSQGRVVSAIWWTDFFASPKAKTAALGLPVVIMAGGEGSRLAPLTQILPKPLMPLGGKPVLQHIMERFSGFGCRQFYLSLNYKSSLIKAYFHDLDHGYGIRYIEERKPLGTAGSLHLLRRRIKSNFFLTNCDVLIDADYGDILDFHRKNGNAITMVASMKHYAIPYGVCRIKSGGRLRAIDEKPEYDLLVNTGMYVLEPAVLAEVPAHTFFHVTDLIHKCVRQKRRVGVYPISEKSWLDIGQWDELQEAIQRFKA
ncbi:MAG: nucleotidyltransferase family protein [Elusimicrobia bacterium]|nr:nucleotidyltransferase family protein [Elusimicrobiota bacterium]